MLYYTPYLEIIYEINRNSMLTDKIEKNLMFTPSYLGLIVGILGYLRLLYSFYPILDILIDFFLSLFDLKRKHQFSFHEKHLFWVMRTFLSLGVYRIRSRVVLPDRPIGFEKPISSFKWIFS